MTNLQHILALSAAILVANVDLASAHSDRAEGPRHSFETLDSDGDGRITPDEMSAHRAARFLDADANGDGMLSRDELASAADARVHKRLDRMIKRHDANGDGLLGPDEMGGRHGGRMFERLDSDGDGGLTREEFAKAGHGNDKSD